MPKTKNTYKEGTKIKSMCRICLTQSNNIMFQLVDQLTGDNNYNAETYLEALEKVTFSRVDLNGHYPQNICPMCVSFLKMSLEFITQYEKSQKRLQKMFKTETPAYQSIELECNSNDDPESEDEEDYLTEEIKYDPNDPLKVELIIKDKKFNLNEILVVENEEKETHDYKGFIKNLGKEISATIVSKKENTINTENNISVLKVVSDEEEMQEVHQSNDENEDEEGEESIKFIVESTDEDHTNTDNEILNNIKIEQMENQENVEIEEHSIESDSQKTSDNDNLEYIEIDMYDKDSIESLIIDRTKLPDGGGDLSTISSYKRRGKNREETTDEFLKEVKFPCDVCKKVYQSRNALKGHVRRSHMNQGQKTFTCEICGNVCRTRSAFVNHKLKHFDKQFKCDLCDKTYTTKAHLKVHMATHTNKRPYLCNVCGKDFNYANALSYHMRLHTGEKNYHCEYCPKRFRMINSLNRHLRTHTGEKPYKCQYCGRDFSSRGEVVCHEYTHTGYRPYHCKYCKKGFSKTHNLKIHLLSHGGPYHCQFCTKTFIEENILTMHNRISHKDLLNEQQMQEGTDEDSQDGAFSQFESLSHDDSMSQDGNLKIELVEEDSDTE